MGSNPQKRKHLCHTPHAFQGSLAVWQLALERASPASTAFVSGIHSITNIICNVHLRPESYPFHFSPNIYRPKGRFSSYYDQSGDFSSQFFELGSSGHSQASTTVATPQKREAQSVKQVGFKIRQPGDQVLVLGSIGRATHFG